MARTQNALTGRISEKDQLLSALQTPNKGLEIIGISGYGGMGKTYLARHVMDELEPEKGGSLVIWLDGGAKDLNGDFMRIVNRASHFVVNPSICRMILQHHQNMIGKREQSKLQKRGVFAVKAAE